MKIVITGAGGGHFYPLLAVVERMYKEAFVQKIVTPEVTFISDKPYDEKALFNLRITFIPIPAGKLRVYPSLETVTDLFKTFYGVLRAIVVLYRLYPDVVFTKGGYASFPTVFAARLLSIPVVVHESDTVPGRMTKWAGRFAARVALSYEEAAPFYKENIVALTGQPIRDALLPPVDFKRIYPTHERPVILIVGGSQGSQTINDAVVKMLPEILSHYDVVHQTGVANLSDVQAYTSSLLKDHPYKDRYFVDGFIDLSLFYPKVDLMISRSGSMIFEAALWQLPMILIPIPESVSRDQRSNAYACASRGVALVLEENNLSTSVLTSEISRIFEHKDIYERMVAACNVFDGSRKAATTIARELIRIGLSHTES